MLPKGSHKLDKGEVGTQSVCGQNDLKKVGWFGVTEAHAWENWWMISVERGMKEPRFLAEVEGRCGLCWLDW